MKKILVIGATSAIAQEVCRIYSKEGASFFLWGRNSQFLETIAQDLKVRGANNIQILSHDLNDLDFHATGVQNAWQSLGGFDIVLLAHGILGNQRDAEKNQDELLNIIHSNFISHASLLIQIAQQMEAQRSGTIAVITSVAGDRGRQSNFVYGSAKAGKSAFVDGLRNRLFPSGVHVINLKLGMVDTPMTKDMKKGPLFASAPQVASGIVSAISHKKDTAYIPFFWRFIMMVIKSIPETIFKKLKL